VVLRSLYAAAVADHVYDPLDTPRCPIHPLEQLVVAGSHPDGRDARWECPIASCRHVQLA
jgi:hypothetical protein